MASESIEILIEAENKASAEIKNVSKDLEEFSKKAKDTGAKTKASVEVIGSLANAFGGSAIGAFASQIGGITEKVSAFSEVAKTGAAGALAFKAGIVVAAGAVTYKVAETIASWWFEIDKAKQKAAEAEKAFTAMSAALSKTRQRAFAQTKEDLGLIRNPGEREKATNDAASKLEKQSKELDRKIQQAQAELAQRQKEFQSQRSSDTTNVDIAQSQLDNLKAMKDELDNEATSLRDLNSERTKSVEARKAENAAADKSESFVKGLEAEVETLRATKEEQLKLEAARNTVGADRGKAEALLQEREELKAKAEEQKKAEAQAEQAAKKEEDAQKKIAELEKKRLVDLEARRIELEKGREAAAAYRLEQEGLTADTAKRLAAMEEQQKKDEELASKAKNLDADTSPQQAVQGRFLRAGTGGDPLLQAANKQTEAIKQLTTELKSGFDDLYEEAKKRGFTVKTAVVP